MGRTALEGFCLWEKSGAGAVVLRTLSAARAAARADGGGVTTDAVAVDRLDEVAACNALGYREVRDELVPCGHDCPADVQRMMMIAGWD